MKHFVFFIICCGLVAMACQSTSRNTIKQAVAHRELGEAYYNDTNYTRALREFLAAEKLTPDDPLIHNDMGMVYLQRDKLPEALAAFQKALQLNPDYNDAILNISVTYLRMQQWDAAIKHLKTLASDMLYASPQKANLNLGYAYYMKDDYAMASDYYNKAAQPYRDGLRKDVTYIMAQMGLARVALNTGRASEALTLLDTALIDAPQVPELHFYRGAALEQMGNAVAARNEYLKVIELTPQGDLSQKAVVALRRLAQ